MVSSLVVSSLRGSDLGVLVALFSETTVGLAGGSQTTEFSVLVDGVADPVDSGVVTDGGVHGVNADDLKEFVGSVFGDPVGVQDSQRRHGLTDTFFGDRAERSLEFKVVDTLTGRLTVDDTLGNGSLAATSSDLDTVDNVSLLGLVTETAGLVDTGGSAGSVDGGELSVFPGSHTEDETHDIGLFLSPEFFQVFVGTHNILIYFIIFRFNRI